MARAAGDTSTSRRACQQTTYGESGVHVRAGIIRDWEPVGIRRGKEREMNGWLPNRPLRASEDARALTATH